MFPCYLINIIIFPDRKKYQNKNVNRVTNMKQDRIITLMRKKITCLNKIQKNENEQFFFSIC